MARIRVDGPASAIQIGDTMQSAASRLAEWVREQVDHHTVPYEVHMAALEAATAVEEWTELRRHWSSS